MHLLPSFNIQALELKKAVGSYFKVKVQGLPWHWQGTGKVPHQGVQGDTSLKLKRQYVLKQQFEVSP